MAAKHHLPDVSTTKAQRSVSGRLVGLVLGDLIAFLIFASIGITSHKETLSFSRLVITVLPFLAGWFLVSPFIGAFRRDVTTQPGKMAVRTALSWVGAWVVSMILRGIFVDRAIPPWTFMLIAFIVNIVFLLIWRVPFAIFGSLKVRRGSSQS